MMAFRKCVCLAAFAVSGASVRSFVLYELQTNGEIQTLGSKALSLIDADALCRMQHCSAIIVLPAIGRDRTVGQPWDSAATLASGTLTIRTAVPVVMRTFQAGELHGDTIGLRVVVTQVQRDTARVFIQGYVAGGYQAVETGMLLVRQRNVWTLKSLITTEI